MILAIIKIQIITCLTDYRNISTKNILSRWFVTISRINLKPGINIIAFTYYFSALNIFALINFSCHCFYIIIFNQIPIKILSSFSSITITSNYARCRRTCYCSVSILNNLIIPQIFFTGRYRLYSGCPT